MASKMRSKLEYFTYNDLVEHDGYDRARSRSSTPQLQHPTIVITSYDRHTPPYPQPDLEYDCHETENPPRKMRLMLTGLSECLQQELMNRNEFRDLVSRAAAEIRHLIEEKLACDDGVPVVTVECLCGSGHHRSVAFAEQLSKRDWPWDWDVKVVHRDLTREVKERKKRNKQKFKEMKEGKGAAKAGRRVE